MLLSTYYVVEFGASPRPDIDQWVCVPETWLTWIDESKALASVAYPGRNPVDIEELARNNTSDPSYWLKYNAHVEFAASSYEQAMESLRALRKIKSFGTISIIPTNERRFSEDLSRQELSKFRLTSTTSNSGGNNKAYKRPSLASPYTRPPTGQIRPQAKKKSPAAERLRLSGSQYPVHDDHPTRSLQASSESRSTNISQETSRSFQMQDIQATRGVSHGCQRPGTSSDHVCCSTRFDAVFRSMQAEMQKLASEFERWRPVTEQNVEKLMTIDAWMKADDKCKSTNASHLSENIKKYTISIQGDEDNDDDVDHGNSSAPNQVITAEEPWRQLPPEYNRNGSKWTLRYHHPWPTLTELLPCSSVFVDTLKLEYCFTVAKDCKALAQMLMEEVFTDRALEVCSLTGTRLNCDIPVSPGLDDNARNVIIRYAVNCGHERKWYMPDVQTIKNSMRDKLRICRRRVTRAMEKQKLSPTINSRCL